MLTKRLGALANGPDPGLVLVPTARDYIPAFKKGPIGRFVHVGTARLTTPGRR